MQFKRIIYPLEIERGDVHTHFCYGAQASIGRETVSDIFLTPRRLCENALFRVKFENTEFAPKEFASKVGCNRSLMCIVNESFSNNKFPYIRVEVSGVETMIDLVPSFLAIVSTTIQAAAP